MIEIRHLKKQYERIAPFTDFSATIHDGDVVSVIGPSGTGKSTLIRCLNRLETPTSGEIIVDGVCITDKKCDLSAVRRNMGMVFQSFNLFPHLTVLENVMNPQIHLLKTDKQTAYKKAMELLESVGMESRALQYPDVLSGGQKQRVAIARTLSTDPKIILFDEPTSALDPTMINEVQSVIRQLAETGKTMIIVTHEMKFAREICNRVFYLDEGGLYEEGTPEEVFDHPKKEKTRRFIRQLKVLEVCFGKENQDTLTLYSMIEDYCRKNRISYELSDRLLAATEELGEQILLKESKTDFVTLVLEYDENRKTVYAKFRYPGALFHPESSKNELALLLLKKNCERFEHSYTAEREPANEVVLHIK